MATTTALSETEAAAFAAEKSVYATIVAMTIVVAAAITGERENMSTACTTSRLTQQWEVTLGKG